MRFLVDSNLPPLLTSWLSQHPHSAVHVDDVIAGSAADTEIWALAKAQGAVIITKDSDFRDRALREAGIQIVWVRCGNLKLSAFAPWFQRRQVAVFALLEAGEPIVEMR